MEETGKKNPHWLRQKIGAQFIEGLLVMVPIAIAIWILKEIITIIDTNVQPFIELVLGPNIHIPLAGFALTLILVYLVGVLTESVIIRRAINFSEAQLARVPVFRYLYIGVKNLLEGFSRSGKGGGFSQVVLIEFPTKGMKTIGFVTSEIRSDEGEKLLTIYVPQSPTPTTGFIEIVRETDVVRLDMSIEDAIKMVVSAGAFSPQELKAKLK